jgi:RHH-type proline utilization regulon transcriptional repressor/proline dehydrogenase/delta 1-pyrroline-5-carboxylate dehydrogenase
MLLPLDSIPSLESAILDIGHDLFARANELQQKEISRDFDPDRWLMRIGMRDPQLKPQLFRFVDVLPALASSQQILIHLKEYMASGATHLPRWQRQAIRLLPESGILAAGIARLASAGAMRMAARFIAASNLTGAIATIEKLRASGRTFTLDLLGEAVLSEADADRYAQRYHDLIRGLADAGCRWPPVDLIDRDFSGPLPRVNVSIKLSSLFSQFDPIDPRATLRGVGQRVRPILRLARDRGVFVNIDMEQHAFKDATLLLFKEIFAEPEFRDWADVGIAIQAYVVDVETNLRDLAAWAQRRGTSVCIRLVKGAYWDYESVIAAQNGWPLPVFARKHLTDASYEAMTRLLMEHYPRLRVAIASHNIRSIAHALAVARQLRLPPRSFEFQMLYGMAEPVQQALVDLGQRVRIYAPFGELLPGMAYLVRRLLENTSNESFLRAGFEDHVPEEQLLMNPMQFIRSPSSARPVQQPNQATPFRNEPPVDFSKESNRISQREAIESVRPYFGAKYCLLIDGQAIERDTTIDSYNPSHQRQLIGRVCRATVEDATHAVAVAKAAFPKWRDTPVRQRAELLLRAAAVMRRRRFELAAWEIHETAKPWREADGDIAEAIDFCEFNARAAIDLFERGGKPLSLPGEANVTLHEPRGVAVVIAPWNFPLAILCGMTAAALVTGNTVVFKPAEQSGVIGAKLMEILIEAGCPAGVANFVPGLGEEIGPELVKHPDVATIAFTGSRAVGLSIQSLAANTPPGQDHVKRVITEMGGKNAIIIDADADLDDAIAGTIASAFGYAGQKCSACSRLIVLQDVYDALVPRLIEAAASLRIGPAEDPATTIPPVIDAEAQSRILKSIDQAKSHARLAFAGDVSGLIEEGSYVGPHIFTDVAPDSQLAQDEIFGPVLAVLRARDLGHALAIANGTRYALTGGVYSRSPANIDRIRREFRVGNLYINRKITGALVARQPFGGFKLSGIGSQAGGTEYLLQFCVPRTISENTMRRGFVADA